MKRATLKAHSTNGGWIRTTIAPVNDKHECRFGVVDVVMFVALVAMVIGIARILIAH